MSKFFPRQSKAPPRGSCPSPGYLLEWAGLLIVLFMVAQFAGLRDFTSVLNGTIGSTNMDWRTAAFLGVAYVFVYLGVVIVVPILAIAALLLKLCQKMVATKEAHDESQRNPQKN